VSGGVLDLGGKRALVTGGSRGVGRATALLLARAGADVGIACQSREDEAREVVETIRSWGREAWVFRGDLSIPGTAEALFHEAARESGGVDILVGNHGIWPPEDVPLSEMEFEQWRRTLSVNLDSLFHLCREGARRIPDDGRIVLVSSTAAQRGEAFHADYAASKGAVISLVKGLCIELAPRGITVNAVAPGWIETDMTADVLEGEAGNRVRSGIPLGRIATAEDVAGPIVFLCSSLARHVTGEVLNVNGGAVLPG
jgi:3-oxoacyl-[acyl-carrier protein] reductase